MKFQNSKIMAKKNFGNSLKRSNNLGAGIQNLLGTSVSQEEEIVEEKKEEDIKEKRVEEKKEKRENKKDTIKQPLPEKRDIPVNHPSSTEAVKINPTEKIVEEKTEVIEEGKVKKAKVAFSRTFYIPENDYKTIENFIRYKIMQGEIRFSQKNALNEALNLLREVIKANISVEPVRDESKEGDILHVHSFNMLIEDYNFINEVLRIRRMQGQIKFTQANVLSEALSLLRKKYPNL